MVDLFPLILSFFLDLKGFDNHIVQNSGPCENFLSMYPYSFGWLISMLLLHCWEIEFYCIIGNIIILLLSYSNTHAQIYRLLAQMQRKCETYA